MDSKGHLETVTDNGTNGLLQILPSKRLNYQFSKNIIMVLVMNLWLLASSTISAVTLAANGE
jgi:hypothetical protein